jgi:hypothetical protein
MLQISAGFSKSINSRIWCSRAVGSLFFIFRSANCTNAGTENLLPNHFEVVFGVIVIAVGDDFFLIRLYLGENISIAFGEGNCSNFIFGSSGSHGLVIFSSDSVCAIEI